MVKLVFVETLGILLGEPKEDGNEIVIDRPLAFGPAQNGGMALQENPLYGTCVRVNKRYVIAQSEAGDTMRDQYEAYAIKKRSGLVTPGDPEMQKSKLKL